MAGTVTDTGVGSGQKGGTRRASSAGWASWREPFVRRESLALAGAFLGTLGAWAVVIPLGLLLGLWLFDAHASVR